MHKPCRRELKLRNGATVKVMARLPHIDLAPPSSRKRNLRVTEATLDAYCQGQIMLEGYSAPHCAASQGKQATKPQGAQATNQPRVR